MILRLALSERGNVALLFAFVLPVILGITALGVDATATNRQKDWMQNATDSVSLAVAKELLLYRDKPDELKSVASTRIESLLQMNGYERYDHSVEVHVDPEGGTVGVSLTMIVPSLLPMEVWSENPLMVTSLARAYGSEKLCVLGLNRTEPRTISIEKGAVLTAPGCAVQSNSPEADGMRVSRDSRVISAATCSSGGVNEAASVSPDPQVDCPPLDDPLAGRIPPAYDGCDFLDFKSDKGTSTLSPGTYCGGMKLENKAVIDLMPGIYVIVGGKVDMGNETELRGEDVGFYFADDKATFDIRDKGLVELSAPREGPMAGILFYGNPDTIKGRHFKISSDSARKLLGTIYLPNSVLKIEGTGKVAEESAYTVIVASRIEIDGSNLVVNADYSATDVPVPAGLGPNSSGLRLER